MDSCCLSFERKKHAFFDRRPGGLFVVAFFLTPKVSIWRNPSLALSQQGIGPANGFREI